MTAHEQLLQSLERVRQHLEAQRTDAVLERVRAVVAPLFVQTHLVLERVRKVLR